MLHASVLRYIVEVARHGSVRKAGLALNIASSGINQRILSLEKELGVQLFVRSPRGMEATTAGRLLVDHAERTLGEFEGLQPLISDVRSLKAGHVRLACDAALYTGIMTAIIEEFLAVHPKVTLSAFALPPEDVVQTMEDGHAEIGLTYAHFGRPNVRSAAEFPAPLGAIVPSGHTLDGKLTVTLPECLGSPLVRLHGPGARDLQLDTIIEREGLKARLCCYTNSMSMAEDMIRGRRAIAIGSRFAFACGSSAEQLRFIPIDHRGLDAYRLAVFIPTTRHLDSIERRFSNVAMAVLRRHTS